MRHVFWDKDPTSFCGLAESDGRQLEYGWGRSVPTGTCCRGCETSFREVRNIGKKTRPYKDDTWEKGTCRHGHDKLLNRRYVSGKYRCGECLRLTNARYYERRYGRATNSEAA